MSIRDYLVLFVKGAIIGIANIIPGVSGGTLMVSLGLYEKIINILNNIIKEFKKNFKFILILGLGVIFGILSSSKLITYALANFKMQTIFLFVGLVFGGISLITKKVRGKINFINILCLLIVFALVIAFNFCNVSLGEISFNNLGIIDYILLIVIGSLASTSMVIPGISGSFVLMVLGYYDSIIGIISDIFNFSHFFHNIIILLFFGIGVILGIVLIAKLIHYLLNKYETKTYFMIIGFVLSSLVVLILQIDKFKLDFISILTSIIAFVWGFFLAKAIDKE